MKKRLFLLPLLVVIESFAMYKSHNVMELIGTGFASEQDLRPRYPRQMEVVGKLSIPQGLEHQLSLLAANGEDAQFFELLFQAIGAGAVDKVISFLKQDSQFASLGNLELISLLLNLKKKVEVSKSLNQ